MAEKRLKRETPTTINDLHTDLLHLIVKRLDQKSLQSVSLVSRCFVPLTNDFITELTFRHLPSSASVIQRIFRRFPSVSEINLKSTSVGRALVAISNSELKIEVLRIYGCPSYPDARTILKLRESPGKLKNVKSLKVSWFGKHIGYRRMVEFIKIFPAVDELDLSSGGRWDDIGIRKLSLNFRKIRKINLSHNELLANTSLHFLGEFCKDLEHFSLGGCSGVSPEGLCQFLLRMPNLHSLCCPAFSQDFTQAGLLLLGCTIGGLKYLTHLAISDNLVNDDVLKAIGKFKLRLTSLEVDKVGTRGLYTMKGLAALLNASRSLTSLEVSLPELDLGYQDRMMSQLVKLLPSLRRIQIHTRNWFHETLFSLIDNCPKLESIVISGDKGKCGSDIPVTPPRQKNYSIEYICIGPRFDESLQRTLVSSCPLLKQLESL